MLEIIPILLVGIVIIVFFNTCYDFIQHIRLVKSIKKEKKRMVLLERSWEFGDIEGCETLPQYLKKGFYELIIKYPNGIVNPCYVGQIKYEVKQPNGYLTFVFNDFICLQACFIQN